MFVTSVTSVNYVMNDFSVFFKVQFFVIFLNIIVLCSQLICLWCVWGGVCQCRCVMDVAMTNI